ncbi:hypothetical protein EC988_003130 [Linderina pennispora]|nr:hypothetical protein EC988_003130 [Linderina pennispora]
MVATESCAELQKVILQAQNNCEETFIPWGCDQTDSERSDSSIASIYNRKLWQRVIRRQLCGRKLEKGQTVSLIIGSQAVTFSILTLFAGEAASDEVVEGSALSTTEFKIAKEAVSDDLVPGYNDIVAELSAEIRSYFASHQHYRQLNTQPMQVIFVHGTAGVGKSAVIKSALQSLPYPVINSSLGDIVVTANGTESADEYVKQAFADLHARAGAASASVIVLDRVDVLADQDLTQEIGKLGMQFLQFTQSLPPSVFMILESTRSATSMPASIKRSIAVQHALEIPVPTRPRREKIVQYAIAKYSRTEGGTEPGGSSLISRIARATAGYVARDLCNLCRQAYLRMLRADNGLRNAMLDAQLVESFSQLSLQDVQEGGERVGSSAPKWIDFADALQIVRPSQQLEFECALPTKTWADIGGYGPVKSMLQRFMKLATSETSSRLGIKPPTGVLLHGPTGCGKTAMALAMIADSSCNVICIRGSELFSKYLGETEARLRRLFQAAQAAAPCVIFMDELDAIAAKREWSSVESGGPGLRVLSTLLNEMDGVHEARGVIAVGCTNQIDKIDDAILRPGRFDQLVHVGMPTLEDRAGIVQTLARNSPLEADVRMDELARLTSDYSGAELEQLFREAGLAAMRSDADAIALSMEDFMDALDKVDDNQQ